ncbi:mitochondrial 37S ribosomal protein mS26 PET123 KNAG_0B03820 [Huiozyma naganishii CBS 8797]|uniref:Uncharacterized protein n=1 Tax=Huiozyma naganishii (strain ATCC MYA-139 / BCRC 22969 / CBS 8797 / KCTC 17520 / NBRC 10181 / NCYC 3082 / Yp74L-3) TaxID=1071383 RepID=J7RH11_HUIN7|nr:hypothetical protein KNAG_0B03820 [Kazachstania naganishii CBS 8797]CCK68823.1 hypothetical protein KNAG_0B03820 [Kazachstania naganishii CBS 8797]
MGKKAVQSGVLPPLRSILKHPTVKQTDVIAKIRERPVLGMRGTGYAPNVQQPLGSRREPRQVEVVDVERIIARSVPQRQDGALASAKAQLRIKYFSESLRQEEQRLVKCAEMIREKQEKMEQQRELELRELAREKLSDLTIPSLPHIISSEVPFMRDRTPEEKQLLAAKREYNRNYREYLTRQEKLEKLLKLYYASEEFIVTEQQLTSRLDKLIPIRRLVTNIEETRRAHLETQLADSLFGTIQQQKPGVPMVREYLDDSAKQFAAEMDAKLSK